MKTSIFVIVILFVFAFASPALAATLNVAITADNAYGFGFGTFDGMSVYYGGLRNLDRYDITGNPTELAPLNIESPYTLHGVGTEIYRVPNPLPTDYVYIVAWSDKATTQGVIAGFQFDLGPLLTGLGKWEVFATGINKNSNVLADTLTVANLSSINDQISLANIKSGGANTSIGWVDEDGKFPNGDPAGRGILAITTKANVQNAIGSGLAPADGISPEAHWMWYNKDPEHVIGDNAFLASSAGSTGHDEYLIFRIKVENILPVPEPSTFVLLGMGLISLLAYAWRRRR